MSMEKKSLEEIISRYPEYDKARIDQLMHTALLSSNVKIVVLDDDPTGTQTVHGVSVYTDWQLNSMLDGFKEANRLFFILTNSRGCTSEQSAQMHKDIATNIVAAAKQTSKKYLIISRSDSTLRGHYPLETQVLKTVVEDTTEAVMDGEIICPFFLEGGRYTHNNIHYVLENNSLVPAGETEFAQDKTFGYKNSHLGMWVEEKTQGQYTRDSCTYITVEELRRVDIDGIYKKLLQTENFSKIIVNALDYYDIKVFVTALYQAIGQGKHFMLRSAAGIVKVIGGIEDKPLLTREELIDTTNKNGGIIVIGSHVKKTTAQLAKLKEWDFITFLEFNVHLVADEALFKQETARIIAASEEQIGQGKTVAVYTRRERLDLNTDNKEDELQIAVQISDAVTSIISSLAIRPNFIIAKGGITSSDIATKGLHVKRALVYGQILAGVPVWLTGEESKFPNMLYVVFPGNVGNETALKEAVEKIQL